MREMRQLKKVMMAYGSVALVNVILGKISERRAVDTLKTIYKNFKQDVSGGNHAGL